MPTFKATGDTTESVEFIESIEPAECMGFIEAGDWRLPAVCRRLTDND
jgi:hypothetical protein